MKIGKLTNQNTIATDKTALLKVLKETQGMWGKASDDELKKDKESRKLELKTAAKARKNIQFAE